MSSLTADQIIFLSALVPMFSAAGGFLIARDLPVVKRWLGEA